MASAAFAFYLDHFDRESATFGAFAGVAVLLLWLFLSSNALLFGAELVSAARARGRLATSSHASSQGYTLGPGLPRRLRNSRPGPGPGRRDRGPARLPDRIATSSREPHWFSPGQEGRAIRQGGARNPSRRGAQSVKEDSQRCSAFRLHGLFGRAFEPIVEHGSDEIGDEPLNLAGANVPTE